MLDRMIDLGIVHCFGGGGGGYVAPAAEPPKASNVEVQAAMEKERALARKRKGRSSTILTGGTGLADQQQGNILLGGGQ